MIEPHKIDSEFEAETYLYDLLEKKECCNMLEVEHRAIKLIPDDKLRAYFIARAREILKA